MLHDVVTEISYVLTSLSIMDVVYSICNALYEDDHLQKVASVGGVEQDENKNEHGFSKLSALLYPDTHHYW